MPRPPDDETRTPAYSGAVPDPAALEADACAWRSVKDLATFARETMNTEARAVVGESWTGDAADAYDQHRGDLARDLEDLAETAGATAQALDQLAATMRSAQDDTSTLEGELAIKEASFVTSRRDLLDMYERWEERTVRVVNLNMGSGNDRWPWPFHKPGMNPREIPEMAEMLVREQNADIITMQEVFEGDLDDMKAELERLTGDTWEYEYAHASDKKRATGEGGMNLDPTSFGNAVFVRVSDDVESVTEVAEHTLSEPGQGGETIEPPNIPSPGIPPDPENPNPPSGGVSAANSEGRSAAHVEVTFRD